MPPTALAAADGSTPPVVRARLELGEATLASSLSQFRTALTASERALELFAELGDARGTAAAQRWAGRSLLYLGEVDRGEALLLDAVHIGRGEKREHAQGRRLLDIVQALCARAAHGKAGVREPAGLDYIGFRDAELGECGLERAVVEEHIVAARGLAFILHLPSQAAAGFSLQRSPFSEAQVFPAGRPLDEALDLQILLSPDEVDSVEPVLPSSFASV